MMQDIFISYSTANKNVAIAACAKLEEAGIRCWMAPRDITPGADWSAAIVDAIDSSKMLLLIFSSESNNSLAVRNEVSRAAGRGIPIVPIRIDDIQPTKALAFYMGSVHWLDASTPPIEAHLARVVDAATLLLRIPPDTKDQSVSLANSLSMQPADPAAPKDKHFILAKGYIAGAAVIESAIACLLLFADPLGISSSVERTIDRWFAVATQFQYVSKAQDKLAVFLINEETLDFYSRNWPLPDSAIADMGRRIACNGAMAIFFDFTATSRYNPEGTSDLRRMIGAPVAENGAKPFRCPSGAEQRQIPVYFANIPTIPTGQLSLQDDLNKLDRTFLVQAEAAENIYSSGPMEFMDYWPKTDEVTPAFGIFRDSCGQSGSGRDSLPAWCPKDRLPATAIPPIFLSWNGNPVAAQMEVREAPECKEEVTGVFEQIFAGIGLLLEPKHSHCPPILTLTGRDLSQDFGYIQAHGVDPASLLAAKIVLVGVNLAGLNDNVTSPVHGDLPGVFAHAVALDNLITYGGRYYTVPDNMKRWTLIFLFVLAINGTLAAFFPTARSKPGRGKKHANFPREKENQIRAIQSKLNSIWVADFLGIFLMAMWVVLSAVFVWYMRWPASLLCTIVVFSAGTAVFYHRIGKIIDQFSSNERRS